VAKEYRVGGYVLPVGSVVACSQYVMHRDPRYYSDPERFDPERWTPEAKATRPQFSYFPFGGGVRRCIGETLAWTEGVLLIAAIAQRWRLRFVADRPVETEPVVTLRPKHAMTMELVRRVRAGGEVAGEYAKAHGAAA
jgi:cytochrome P450